MVAAILGNDDRLVGWLQTIAEVRYNTEFCEEYRAALPHEDPFCLRDHVHLEHEVYKDALLMVADIKSRLATGVRYGSARI
jgi:hypothetical protein